MTGKKHKESTKKLMKEKALIREENKRVKRSLNKNDKIN